MSEFNVEDYMPRIYMDQDVESLIEADRHRFPDESKLEIILSGAKSTRDETRLSNKQFKELVTICEDENGPATESDILKAINLLKTRLDIKMTKNEKTLKEIKMILSTISKNLSYKATLLREICEVFLSYLPERISVVKETYNRLKQIYVERFGNKIIEEGTPDIIFGASIIVLDRITEDIQSMIENNKIYRMNTGSSLLRIDKKMNEIDRRLMGVLVDV